MLPKKMNQRRLFLRQLNEEHFTCSIVKCTSDKKFCNETCYSEYSQYT